MIDDSDPCEVWRETRIKHGRKEYKCSECYRQIAIGEPNLTVFYVYKGKCETFHICQHCSVACDWLHRNCGGFLVNGVCEDIDQHTEGIDGNLMLSMLRLKWGMQHKWSRKGQLMPLPKEPPDHPDEIIGGNR